MVPQTSDFRSCTAIAFLPAIGCWHSCAFLFPYCPVVTRPHEGITSAAGFASKLARLPESPEIRHSPALDGAPPHSGGRRKAIPVAGSGMSDATGCTGGERFIRAGQETGQPRNTSYTARENPQRRSSTVSAPRSRAPQPGAARGQKQKQVWSTFELRTLLRILHVHGFPKFHGLLMKVDPWDEGWELTRPTAWDNGAGVADPGSRFGADDVDDLAG